MVDFILIHLPEIRLGNVAVLPDLIFLQSSVMIFFLNLPVGKILMAVQGAYAKEKILPTQ